MSEPGSDSGESVAPDPGAADTAEPTKPKSWAQRTGEWPIWRTGEWPTMRVDLAASIAESMAEAYAAVRQRGAALRRRRIISGVVAAIVLTGVFTVVGVYYVSTIPLPDALALPETTTIYYSDGTTVMARLGSENRSLVAIGSLPDHVGAAVVAAEDPAFWLDSATLISRQYARVATGLDQGSPSGQARLLVTSWKLEDTYTKPQILEFYLNTVYFGRGAYGIEAAARAYFHKHAYELTTAESIVLAGVIESPGDGKFDPTVNVASARAQFDDVAERMLLMGTLDREARGRLGTPVVYPYDLTLFQSGLDRPTGLVVAQVLAELRATPAFRDKPPHALEEGGYSIVTTLDARVQPLLERLTDETVSGSMMSGQPENLLAAAVVVEPGTGRVLAYYGGHNGAGADYAGWYFTDDGIAVGYGGHPPGQTFGVFAVAAALAQGISVQSRWDSPETKEFPGRSGDAALHDFVDAPCRPACTLADVLTGPLNVPLYALTERVGAGRVIEMARAAGVGAMWVPESPGVERKRYDLTESSGSGLTPTPFGSGVGLGEFPVTVLDQAGTMATFAAAGVPNRTHFVQRVSKGSTTAYSEELRPGPRVLDEGEAADLTWALSQNPVGALPGGRPSAAVAGQGGLRGSAVETAHAWTVGYTGNLALAVWVGNRDVELPLKDREGARVTGSGLPAEIYRAFMTEVHDQLALPVMAFPAPVFGGDAALGDARPE